MGNSVEQPDFYYVIVNESHTFDFEGRPTRETVERTFAEFLDMEYGVPDKDHSDQERNFRILPTDHYTYAVHSDSERFGTDAKVFEWGIWTECVNYIAKHKEPEEWRYYIIPDLMTWQHGQSRQSPTTLKHYDTISEAVTRFQELRKKPYNSEEAPIPDTGRSYARLILGIEGVTTPSAVDVIHVEADFDAYYDSGGADYLKPSKNQQEKYELVEFSSWDNPYFYLPENIHAAEITPEQQFAQELAQFCRDYDPYSSPHRKEIPILCRMIFYRTYPPVQTWESANG